MAAEHVVQQGRSGPTAADEEDRSIDHRVAAHRHEGSDLRLTTRGRRRLRLARIGQLDPYRFVFIGGVHRSGTSSLHAALRSHPRMSGFEGTGVRQDEGQYLQTVFSTAPRVIGPARFAFSRAAHQTERSSLAVPETGNRLFEEWSTHWDLGCEILLEKSPPNVLRMRLLQAVFPATTFVVVLRHPLMASLATKKWARGRSMHRLLEHWFRCYERAFEDARHLDSVELVKFEELAASPGVVLDRLAGALGVEPAFDLPTFDDRAGGVYRSRWDAYRQSAARRRYAERIVKTFESRANAFGYSLVDLDRSDTLSRPG